MHNSLFLIDVEGDAYSRGMQVGKATKRQIDHSLSVYKQTFSVCGISWQAAKDKASNFHVLVKGVYPALLEELKGMADGSGVDFDDLFTLNCRTEILPPDFLARALDGTDKLPPEGGHANECTSVAFNRSSSSPVWLAQNWDWIGLQRQALIVIRAKTDDNNQFITVTEAGMLAKIGLNQNGFGMCLNILRSHDDGKSVGLPVHFLLRGLLEYHSVEQAKTFINGTQFASSSNVLIADSSGDMASMELSPNGVCALLATNNSVCHTNHFIDPALAKNDAADASNLSTGIRLEVAQHQIASVSDLSCIKSLLSDTSKGTESICKFPDTTLPLIAQIETVAGIAMNLTTRELWVSDAQPSVSEFRHYAL